MKPILLIHGYSSEGKKNTAKEIYDTLPDNLRAEFGRGKIKELNLSRWISLNDGIALDDVSLAMDRALKARHTKLLTSGFHVVIHSTGALVVRNWIRKFSPKPCPIENLVHLAGAHFGSGLAHVGKGQLSRWGRQIAAHTGSGKLVLDELLFGSWKSIDLARHFLQPGNNMLTDYKVQEFCIIGSQIPTMLRPIPVRYVKEDSSDNTVRTSSGNLNFSHISVTPEPSAFNLSIAKLEKLVDERQEGKTIEASHYKVHYAGISTARQRVPFAIAYETAHFGGKIGIVSGTANRKKVMPLIRTALATPHDPREYQKSVEAFDKATEKTFKRAAKLSRSITAWNPQSQYEAHSQLIFRIRDQNGKGVKDFDITFKSKGKGAKRPKLESMIEDRRLNKNHPGTLTFYLRTQGFKSSKWKDLLETIRPVDVEITGTEALSDDITYVPLRIRLTSEQVAAALHNFETTIIDIEMLRLPSHNVFKISKSQPK